MATNKITKKNGGINIYILTTDSNQKLFVEIISTSGAVKKTEGEKLKTIRSDTFI